MANRTAPYPAYNYLVDLKGPRDPEKPLGGFSDVAGLKTELHISEYRDGNDKANYVHKFSGMHATADVTLKRGLVDTSDLWDWIRDARVNGSSAQRDVTISLRDEANNPVQVFKLSTSLPRVIPGRRSAAKERVTLPSRNWCLLLNASKSLMPVSNSEAQRVVFARECHESRYLR